MNFSLLILIARRSSGELPKIAGRRDEIQGQGGRVGGEAETPADVLGGGKSICDLVCPCIPALWDITSTRKLCNVLHTLSTHYYHHTSATLEFLAQQPNESPPRRADNLVLVPDSQGDKVSAERILTAYIFGDSASDIN
ncbi:hypothetical protein FKM82_013809 [Ascaphus truei]